MRMLRAENTIVTSGATDTRRSGMTGDAKMTYVLLTAMVADKIEYCLREPGTNAWEANPKRPFELTLPSRFINIVRFRDFGKGLSHHFMMTKYSRIGHSTKDGDDDAIGGWGLGSKSPLAYLMRQDGAGAFDVISRHQGVRRVYNIGINAQGAIEISFLGEAPMDDTDRGTGLEVSFPVRPEDVQRFKDYAERIFWGFTPAPIVLPEQGLKIGEGVKTLGTKTWSMWKDTPWSGPHVRIGVVMYPLRLDQLDGLSGFVLKTDNILIEAPIGSLSVSASREQLSYDDRTKDTLVKLLAGYEQDFLDKAEAAMAKCGTYFEACKVAKDLSHAFGWERTKTVQKRLSWRGIQVREHAFKETGPDAFWRAMTFSRGSTFRAEVLSSVDLAGYKIAVEHSAYRSAERLEALGLDKADTLWVRVKKPEFQGFLDAFGLTEADVTIMDKVKLPKRELGSAPNTKVRVRKQLNWFGHSETGPVDLLGGGYFVLFEGRGRHHATANLDPFNNGTSLIKEKEQRRLNGLFDKLTKAGVLTEEMTQRPILLLTKEEALEDGWEPLGPALREAVLDKLDMDKLTPRRVWGINSFRSELKTLDQVDLGLAPQELIDLVHKRRQLLATIVTVDDDGEPEVLNTVLNEHDVLIDILKTFVENVVVPVSADPTAVVNNAYIEFEAKHPIFAFLMDKVRLDYSCKNGVWGYYGITKEDQRLIDAYFTLAAKI